MKNFCEQFLYRPDSDVFFFCQQSVLESTLPVAETTIYTKTNITLSFGLYEGR